MLLNGLDCLAGRELVYKDLHHEVIHLLEGVLFLVVLGNIRIVQHSFDILCLGDDRKVTEEHFPVLFFSQLRIVFLVSVDASRKLFVRVYLGALFYRR